MEVTNTGVIDITDVVVGFGGKFQIFAYPEVTVIKIFYIIYKNIYCIKN